MSGWEAGWGSHDAPLPSSCSTLGEILRLSKPVSLLVKCGANGSDPESHAPGCHVVLRVSQGPPETGAIFTPLPSPRVANFGPQPSLTSDLHF